jgi:hypothetical protein
MHLFIEKSVNNSFAHHNLTMFCDKEQYTNNNNNVNNNKKAKADVNGGCDRRQIICHQDVADGNFCDNNSDSSDSDFELNESDVTLVDDFYDESSPQNEAQKMFLEVVEVLRYEQEVKGKTEITMFVWGSKYT